MTNGSFFTVGRTTLLNDITGRCLEIVLFAFLLLLSSRLQAAEPDLSRHEFVQIRMGVAVRIIVYAPAETIAIQASDAAYARLRDLDHCLSDYDPDSELNRLCRSPIGEAVPVSEDLWRMLSVSRQYSVASDGAFDVTVGPLIKLWRIARRRKVLPDPAELAAARESVGYQNVELDPVRKTATLKRSEIQLDFGGIAKGYGADEAYRVLAEQGLPISLVAVSGEIRVGDPPPGKAGWRVEVEERGRGAPEGHSPLVLTLCRQAVSTAGDTYQFLELNGIRYSHIVDPATGMGMTVPGSVSVVAPTCLETDALDTILVLMGPERGLKFLGSYPQAEALFIQLDEKKEAAISKSAGWDAMLRTHQPE